MADNVLEQTKKWAQEKFGKDSEAMKHIETVIQWYETSAGQATVPGAGTLCHLDKGMQDVETVNESSEKAFKEKVKQLVSQGYRIAASDCGYVGDVGGNVYDCEYWMAILVKDIPMFGGALCPRK